MFFFCLFPTSSMYPFMCLSYAGCRLLSRIMSSRVFLAFKANNAVMIYAVPLVGNGLVAQRTIVDLLYDVSFCPLSRTLIQFVQSCYSPPQPSALPKSVWNGSITNRSIIPEDIVFIYFYFFFAPLLFSLHLELRKLAHFFSFFFLCIDTGEKTSFHQKDSFFLWQKYKKMSISYYWKCRVGVFAQGYWSLLA